MLEITRCQMSYPSALLRAWKGKRYGMLTSSAASAYLKEILIQKARNRPGTRRFFGEAFVATRRKHKQGYYSSFKWLTNARFIEGGDFGRGPTARHKDEFREALRTHFTTRSLRALQSGAKRTPGRAPVAPDLWLIDRKGNHRFIEVKLPGDKVAEHQLAGLRTIARHLRGRGRARVTVEVIALTEKAKV